MKQMACRAAKRQDLMSPDLGQHAAMRTSDPPLPVRNDGFREPRFAQSFTLLPTRSSQESRQHANTLAGHPLPENVRTGLEDRFQTSLETVRVHDSIPAARIARQHRANALAIGNDIYFGKGRYQPDDTAGRRLIAHEVAHVLQQRSGRTAGTPASAEREASEVASRLNGSAPLQVRQYVTNPVPPLCSAATLKAAIEDEIDDVSVNMENVYPAIRNEPQTERDSVRQDQVLERNIRREVSEMELLKTYLLLRYQRESQFPAHFRAFIEATDRVGTHEARIYSILRGVTPTERTEMQTMPGLVEVIEDEMSGGERQQALQLLYGNVSRVRSEVTTARGSTHLEETERYTLNIRADQGFETVRSEMTEAAEREGRDVLLEDTSLWAIIADHYNQEEFWYLRMIARYRGETHFPRLTGPGASNEQVIVPIWESVRDAGTDEDRLVNTLQNVNAATGMTGGGGRALLPSPTDEIKADPSFIPMLEDELSGDDLRRALAAVTASATATANIRDYLEDAINDHDMTRIRTLLQAPTLSATDRNSLRFDAVILDEMGEELSGAQLCETSLLLRYGNAPFPPDVVTLLGKFQSDPIDVAGAVTFLQSLAAPPAGRLRALRAAPGIYFMLTNSRLPFSDETRLLAAIRADQSAYQEPGSEGTHRHHVENFQSRLPVHFAGTEIRIPIRCTLNTSNMRGTSEIDSGQIEDWLRSIDEIWNNRYSLQNNGSTYALVFAPYMAANLSNPDVTVYLMNWIGRSFVRSQWDSTARVWLNREMHLYTEGLEPVTVAHEFGHVLGNPDEYDLTPTEYRRLSGQPGTTPPPRGGETVPVLMGSQYRSTEIRERHVAPALEVVNMARDTTVFPNPFTMHRR